jgi:nitrogen regulatory protein PII
MQSTKNTAEFSESKAVKKTAKRKPVAKKTTPVNDGFRKLKILITVVNRSKTEFFMDLLTAYEVNLQTAVLAQGTATNDTLHMLGLEDADKSVIFSVIREDKAEEALHAIEDKFSTLKKGKGIAFTVPMSSVIGVAMYRFLSNHRA